MKKFIMVVGIISVFLAGCTENDSSPVKKTEKSVVVETTESTVVEAPGGLDFLDHFTEYGYSVEQIGEMKTILMNVGIMEIDEVEPEDVVYGMQVVKGVAYTDGKGTPKEVQVQFNIENGAVYMVSIYCPSYGNVNQTPYLSGLSNRRADLYYDTDGGYLKKIDWERREVVDY